MKKIKKIIATIAILTIAVSAMGCKMIEKTPEAIQKTVLATIGSEKIIKGDFDKQMSRSDAQLKQQLGNDYATNDKVKDQLTKVKKQQLDNMVTEKILLQKATELNLKPSDDDINKQVDDQITQIKIQYPAEGQFESALQQNSFTEDELKEAIKNGIIENAVKEDMVKDVTVTDDDVQTYYDENKDTKFTTAGEIDYDKSLEDAKALKDKIDAGTDFAELAKSSSADPGSKDNGGSLGNVPYNSTSLVAEFMNGFKNLKEGEVSQPVKSQFGYHIIKVTGVTNDGANVSHILVADKKDSKLTPIDQVKDQIKSTLLQQKQGDAFNSKVEEWKTGLKVKTYEDQL